MPDCARWGAVSLDAEQAGLMTPGSVVMHEECALRAHEVAIGLLTRPSQKESKDAESE